MKREHRVILVQLVGGNLPRRDLAKQTILHGHGLLLFIVKMINFTVISQTLGTANLRFLIG
jgi:hypothetical protein